MYKGHREAKRLIAKGIGRKMDQKSSAISRWLNRKVNLTFKSIANLEAELGKILIEIATRSIQGKNGKTVKLFLKGGRGKQKNLNVSMMWSGFTIAKLYL